LRRQSRAASPAPRAWAMSARMLICLEIPYCA
jgi:hypothetical protein